MTTRLLTVLASACLLQVTLACKNCVVLGKAEKAMFRAHSDACLAQSQVDPRLVETLLNGELTDDAALRRHVYCVLVKCKVVGKDGKLLKSAVLGKLAMRSDGKNASKILENCSEQSANLAPEDAAWNLFRCGYDRKAVLFDYMPTDKQPAVEA
nr:odorant binding protein 14 [Apocheima cinerarius]